MGLVWGEAAGKVLWPDGCFVGSSGRAVNGSVRRHLLKVEIHIIYIIARAYIYNNE